MSNLVTYDIFLRYKVLSWSVEKLSEYILAHPLCVYSPLLVQSRSRSQLIQYVLSLMSIGPDGKDDKGGSKDAAQHTTSTAQGQTVQRAKT